MGLTEVAGVKLQEHGLAQNKLSFPSPLAATIIVIMIITVVGDVRGFVWR